MSDTKSKSTLEAGSFDAGDIEHRVSRRSFIKATSLAGGAVLMQACGDGSASFAPDASAAPIDVPRVRAGQQFEGNLSTDVLVYGATPSGLMAAVGAAKLGAQVLIVEPTIYVGGMIVSGLCRTDYRGYSYRFMNPETREFYKMAAANRGIDLFDAALDHWNFTSSEYVAVIKSYVARYNLRILMGARIRLANGVVKRGSHVVAALFENEQGLEVAHVRAQQYIDSTYTGDLAYVAGAAFIVGRESSSQYDERHAGVCNPSRLYVDPYVQPGIPSSGLLPGVVDRKPPPIGSADSAVQWSCHRLVMTNVKAHQVPFQPPVNFNTHRYEILRRWMRTNSVTKLNQLFTRYAVNSTLGPGAVEAWNNNFVTLNMLGGQHTFANASYQERKQLDDDLANYTLGLFFWLSTDDSVPRSIKDELAVWGLLSSELYDARGLPPIPYRREGRRLLGAPYTVTEHDVLGRVRSANGIAYGYYNVDVHHCGAWFDGSYVVLDGLFSASPPNIYPIDRGCTLPNREELDNVQVSVCVSATHVAWGSLRIEPTLQSIGEACGLAAAIAVKTAIPVHDLSTQDLRRALDLAESDRNYLVLKQDGDKNFDGSAVTNLVTEFGSIRVTGAWSFDPGPIGWHQAARGNYQDLGTVKGEKSIRFYPNFPESNFYHIRAWIPSRNSVDLPDASVLTVTVFASGQRHDIEIHPKRDDLVGAVIGGWRFRPGGDDYIEFSNAGTQGNRVRLSGISWELPAT